GHGGRARGGREMGGPCQRDRNRRPERDDDSRKRYLAPGAVIAEAIQSRNAELDCCVACVLRNDKLRPYMLTTVIPGRCGASNPESRDSGSGAWRHPGMTDFLRSPDQ